MKNYLFSISLAALAASAAQAETRDVMVVMDVSGSMWGQIDGVTKIEIARDVFADVSQDWGQDGIAAGLIAYGHRRKGDCADIELLAPVDASSTAQLGALVNGLTPRGKTPLSDAVRMAAETMKFTEDAATVILLTDGVETCNADPCALGAELERLGVDFTTHVIGFDIANAADKAQLQCLASATGGRYLDSGDAGALGDALRQITEAEPEPVAPATAPLRLALDYAEGTTRPQSVRFQARNPETGEIRDLGTLTGTEQVVSGLATQLETGTWVIDALSDEGLGSLEITHNDDQSVYVPFAALPVQASIQDGSPYQLGTDITVFLEASGLQQNAEFPIALYDGAGNRIDWETRFGSDGDGLSVHDLVSPDTAGTYRIVLGDPDAPVVERQVEFTTDATPQWRGARQGAPGGTIPTHIAGNTYYYNALTLSQGGTEVVSQQLGYYGNPLQLPQQPGIYDLTYSYSDVNGESQIADLGQITVGDGGAAALPDDADAVAPPPGMDGAALETTGDTQQAMDADAHGWEPSSPAATADAALLRDANAEDVVFRCHEKLCHYDDPTTGLTGIPVHGDFALLRPEILDGRKVFIETVNEWNGEWAVLNPIMQTDMVTECVGFSTEGWHGSSGAPETDLACTVQGANGYTFQQMETLAMWASDRNAALLDADRAAHDAAMGEDAPGTPAGTFQDNWIVTNLESGAELMHWQLIHDQGAQEVYLDLTGLAGTAFEGIASSISDTPSITLTGHTKGQGALALHLEKTTPQGTLIGMFTRPSGWNGREDTYIGALQLMGGSKPFSAVVHLKRASDQRAVASPVTQIEGVLDALSGGPESLLSDDANDLMKGLGQIEGMGQMLSGQGDMSSVLDMLSDPKAMEQLMQIGEQMPAMDATYAVSIPETANGGLVEILDSDGAPILAWVAAPGVRLVDLPEGTYTARITDPDGQTSELAIIREGDDQ